MLNPLHVNWHSVAQSSFLAFEALDNTMNEEMREAARDAAHEVWRLLESVAEYEANTRE